MEKLAIIGTGVAGMGCGYFLHKDYDITVYEQNNYIGGHTNTVTVGEVGRTVFIDTGFMVYNDVTYPNLIRLFKELGVEEMNTSMSFSVQHKPTGLEYSGSGINGLFAQRKNILNFRFIRMLRQINRFNDVCIEVLDDDRFSRTTVGQYVRDKGYGEDFLHQYLVPMSSAVWSTPPDLMLNFPIRTLVRFFHNHGFLGLHTQHQWKTLVRGSQSYREKMIAPFRERILVHRPARQVARDMNGKAVVTDSAGQQTYDKVIIATHADQALRLLARPTEQEFRLLKEFHYQTNTATLHTDSSLMPKTRRTWSSWNYRIDAGGNPATIYWMNSLQKVSDRQNYFVSINGADDVDPAKIIQRIEYEHPLFSVEAVDAQKELYKLNTGGPIYFCGSYFKYGFHEDAFTSALELSRQLSRGKIWE